MIHRAGRLRGWAPHALLVAFAWLPALAGGQLPTEQVPTLAPMIERVSPAVVNISVSGTLTFDSPLAEDPYFRRFFPDSDRPVQSAGSGVIVDADAGYVLTNHHVVANADSITVTLFDNRSLDARIIGTDEGSDIAVLKIEAGELDEISLGDSDAVRVGDFVVAIGNPFGLSHSVTSGIISGLGRNSINPYDTAYEDFIQTDASINPGNSGGALVGLTGELLGINSAILSRGGGNIGIGFAIPVNMARHVMDQLIEFGTVRRGQLGVSINTVTPDIAVTHGLSDTSGALIRNVIPNSAAAGAGLRVDDVIVSVNGRRVRDAGSLRAAIGLLQPGERVSVGFVREGREQSIDVELGTAAEPLSASGAESDVESIDPVFEGVELVATGRSSLDENLDGLLVSRVARGSLAALRGLQTGDVITDINGRRVRNLAEAAAAVSGARSVVLGVRRGRRSTSIEMR